jgi:MoxR-like ATPase
MSAAPSIDLASLEAEAQHFKSQFTEARAAIGRVIVGQTRTVEAALTAIMCGGNVLLEGVPGLGKTELVKALSRVLDLEFRRVQFTPDLMPADIVGTNVMSTDENGHYRFEFRKGPIFTQLLLADEINRASPKTQSALLETMQEHSVTTGGTIYQLKEPFFVLATQNPIEQEGTYPLPEAQLDRFMFNVVINYLPEEDEVAVVEQTTARRPADIQPLFSGEDVLRFHELIRQMPISKNLIRHAVRLAAASRPHQANSPAFINEWVSWGAGTRACQFLVLGAKTRALLYGRPSVSLEDLHALAGPVLRHRILVNYRAEAEGASVETIIQRLLETVKE